MKEFLLSESHQLQRIIFWEPCVSPHKIDFIDAVSKALPNIEIICCADQGLLESRKKLGWKITTSELFTTIISPNTKQIDRLVLAKVNHTLHVFSGTRHLHTLTTGLQAVKSYNAHFAIMSEPRVSEGWKGALRFIQSWLTEGWLRKNCKFVLAIGINGTPWFKSVGYPHTQIFPFAYFVPSPKLKQNLLESNPEPTNLSIVRVGYVGRMIAMKGIFDLVASANYLNKCIHLTFVGIGEDQDALKKRCKTDNLIADFHGVLPIQEIGRVMEKIDVLVLASTSSDDGWGVVVSEALMSGTAVVATNCVGASLMLNHSLFGYIVPTHSPIDIANAIKKLKDSKAFTNQKRLARKTLAKARLTPEAGACYFTEILQFQFNEGKYPQLFFLYKEN